MMVAAPPAFGQTALVSYDDPHDEGLIWKSGRRFEVAPREPVVATVEEGDGGVIPTLNQSPVCLMTSRLAEVLAQAGVDNIDFYQAEIHDANTGIVHREHKAFNLIGAVSAADMNASAYTALGGPKISVNFDHLVLKEAAGGGLLMFRLAEAMSGIVVHDVVKRAVEAAGIEGVEFLQPSEWIS